MERERLGRRGTGRERSNTPGAPPSSPLRAEASIPLRARFRDGIQMAHSSPVKARHTLAKFFIESCIVYLLFAGFTKRTDR